MRRYLVSGLVVGTVGLLAGCGASGPDAEAQARASAEVCTIMGSPPPVATGAPCQPSPPPTGAAESTLSPVSPLASSASPTANLSVSPSPSAAPVTSLAPDSTDPVVVDAYRLSAEDGGTALDAASFRSAVQVLYTDPLRQLADCPGSGGLEATAQGVDKAALALHKDRRDVLSDLTANGVGSYCGDVIANYIDSGGNSSDVGAPQAPSSAAPKGCTTTSSGTCIRSGEFCSVADEGTDGTDAAGTTYECEDVDGDGHPHWVTP